MKNKITNRFTIVTILLSSLCFTAFAQQIVHFKDPNCGFSIEVLEGMESQETNSMIVCNYSDGNSVIQVRKVDMLAVYQSFDKNISRGQLNYNDWDRATMRDVLENQALSYFGVLKEQIPEMVIDEKKIDIIDGKTCLRMVYSVQFADGDALKKVISTNYTFLIQGYQISVVTYSVGAQEAAIRELEAAARSIRFTM